MRKNENQAGYTLLESLAVFAVISVVAVSLINIVGHMYERYKNSRLEEQIVELERAIGRRFAAAESYAGLSLKLLKNEKLIPADVDVSGTGDAVALKHKYGGAITISTTGTKPYEYTITFTKVPRVPCVEMATRNWEQDQSSNLVSMTVNNNKLEWRTNDDTKRMPISTASANSFCNTEMSNTISWVFQ